MNERFFITVPASLLLWAAALMLLAWSAGHETERALQGRDTVTVRIAMQAHEAVAPAPVTPPPPPPPPPKPMEKKIVTPVAKPIEPKPQEPPKKVNAPPSPAMPERHLSEEKTDNGGAVVLYQPLPKIPDELRREAFRTVAVARFHVAVDGSAEAELITPAQNPRLNQLLMASLRSWKFKPAMTDGRPIASVVTIRVHFAVQ